MRENGRTIFEPIRLDNLLRLVKDIRHVDLQSQISNKGFSKYPLITEQCIAETRTYPDDMLRPCLCSEHAQYPSTAPNVEDGLALEEVWVVHDGGTVRARPDGILEHLFVNACEAR